MSLYDEFEVPKNKNESWNAGLTPSINLMQAHVNNLRKASKVRQSTTVVKSTNNSDIKTQSEGGYRFNHLTGKMEKCEIVSNTEDDAVCRLGVKDEYNPLFPNDYEQISKILQTKRKIEEQKREDDLNSEIPVKIVKVEHDIEKDSTRFGAAIAPPPSLLEDTLLNEDLEIEKTGGNCHAAAVAAIAATQAKYGTTSTAAKIMVKMGFKDGQGLGREGQGMSTALQVEKTSSKQGKIIHERDIAKKSTMFQDQLSNVVLLTNMVGPGEVDDDLQPETAEECGKYGMVASCNVFELQDVPDEQAVRIFVEFVEVHSALRAVSDLNGRYFGGRIVSAGFYDSEKFKNLELSDEAWNINEYNVN